MTFQYFLNNIDNLHDISLNTIVRFPRAGLRILTILYSVYRKLSNIRQLIIIDIESIESFGQK